MQAHEAQSLLQRYLDGSCSAEEVLLVERWFAGLTEYSDLELTPDMIAAKGIDMEKRLLQQIRSQTPTNLRIPFYRKNWLKYAAAVILLAGAAVYFYRFPEKDQALLTESTPSVAADILPGTTKATLTLSNGEKVELTNEQVLITDGELAITNNKGALSYQESGRAVMNTMTTPRGGQYQLTLADGTKVWMNAASSITYPTSFTNNNNREVQVSGEVYFEVARNKSQPFVVRTATDRITVLGTQFNVNAYSDEAGVKTSLLEGAVKVGSSLLAPGQAYLNGKIVPTNTTQDVAWKNGVFNFNNKSLDIVLRELSRWYDLEVVYPRGVPNIEMVGKMDRQLALSQVLKILQSMEVHYTLHHRTLTVMP